MSMATLIQVYDEMRRLAIAGSSVAPGDFRLKKLIPPLEKSGEKAPVFARIAQAVASVVESTEKTAAAALLELTTLVNAVLYTQGETGVKGKLKPVESVNLGGEATQASARVLKPLLESLTTTGSGRLEIIRDAIERGLFRDLRLVKPAIAAIDDTYGEVADLVTEKVLPMYGKAMYPELLATFQIKGRGGHVRRLKLMHAVDPEQTRPLVQRALEEGSKEVKVAAISCLGSNDDDIPFLLEQVKAKAKDVRAAALSSLVDSGSKSKDVIAAIKGAIENADVELLAGCLEDSDIKELHEHVLSEAKAYLKAAKGEKDAKKSAAAMQRVSQLISCMARRSEAEEFLLECFKNRKEIHKIKASVAGSDINEQVAHLLAFGAPKMQKSLAAEHADLSDRMFDSALYAARAVMSSKEFYETFSSELGPSSTRGKKRDRSDALADALHNEDGNYYYYRSHYYNPYISFYRHRYTKEAKKFAELDPRWLDRALEVGHREVVMTLARPGHAKLEKYLAEDLDKQKDLWDVLETLRTMVKIEHKGMVDATIKCIKRAAKSEHYYAYWLARTIPDLPTSALPKLDEVLKTLPEKLADELLEPIEELRLIARKEKA